MDWEVFFVSLIFILFIVVFTVLIVSGSRAEKRRQAAFVELATRRGWDYRYDPPAHGKRSGIYRLADTDAGWTIEIVRGRSSGGASNARSSNPGRTEFRRADPSLQGGLVMAMAESPGQMSKLAGSVTGLFDNAIGRGLLARAVGQDVADHFGDLQNFPMPENLRIDVMATADPTLWFDMEAISKAIHAWNPVRRGMRAPPTLRISDQGMTLHLPYECSEAENIEKFADLAQGLAEQLNRR